MKHPIFGEIKYHEFLHRWEGEVKAPFFTDYSIGPTAQQAVPALLQLASDEDYLIRVRARAALKVISPAVRPW